MRRMTARPAAMAAALLCSAVVPVAAGAQGGAATIALTRPEAEYAEPFTYVAGVRELRDGRVIVADRQEKTLQLLDLARGTATKLGREGGGPNEYAMPLGVFSLPGDSTVVFDGGNMRYLVLAPDGTPVRTFATMEPGAPDMRVAMPPRAVDGQGKLYFLDRGLRMGPGGPPAGGFTPPDSGTVLRYDPATKRVEEVGKVALPKTSVNSSGGTNERRVMIRVGTPFAVQDDWAAGLDGRIAVVRSEPYRVEWVAPNGQRVTGPAIAYEKIRVTEQDKENYRNARTSVSAMGMRVTVDNGRTSVSSGPPPATTAMRPSEPESWPEFKPAFQANQSVVAPDGRLWVSRYREADDEQPRYDVFDGYGRLVARAVLPANTRLVGFGARSAYLVRTDEDDLQWLQRYRLY